MAYEKQVEADHYSFERYFYRGRWMSYWYQVKEIVTCEGVRSLLDIGPGTTLMRDMLSAHAPHIAYESLDIDPELQPDHVGGVTAIPLPAASVDCVTAFQVLEHIEFVDVDTALQEIARISRQHAIISLPHFGPQCTFSCKIPFLPRMQFAVKVPWPKRLEFSGQHYWEVGRKGYPPKKIRQVLERYFIIKKEYVPFENQYHRFYVLEKKI